MAPRVANTRGWFRDDELEECPRCKQRAALTARDAGVVVCTECGVVGFRTVGWDGRAYDELVAERRSA